jgi:hypothetical protein
VTPGLCENCALGCQSIHAAHRAIDNLTIGVILFNHHHNVIGSGREGALPPSVGVAERARVHLPALWHHSRISFLHRMYRIWFLVDQNEAGEQNTPFACRVR